ncbi:MAG: 4-hydroxythreonine-4-phosphate dehydrogenase PdxA [Deltaproteobacteria bacterium]|nr:4-hydroxythreonine-4-phosphate dehydrogenase PdxA [Deltaproteobacteria bacterium]
MLPLIGITVGDPKGIGPEIAEAACCDPKIHSLCKIQIITPRENPYIALERASHLCLTGNIDALVTGPVHKENMRHYTHKKFLGHTEFLKTTCEKFYKKSFQPTMLFVSNVHRLALVTTHLPLQKVSQNITKPRLQKIILNVHKSLQQDFGIPRPTIAVLGLNPHAGEGGLLGNEEIKVITPTLGWAKKRGLHVSGPFSADSFFAVHWGRFDAVIAQYHDQGLTVFKALHFHHAVQMTLGLPIIRTSVDHGVGYDIAKKKIANPESMKRAILLAIDLVKRRKHVLRKSTDFS